LNLSTRELLFLEDTAKLFESISKNCNRGIQMTTDPQLKGLLQNLKQDHDAWVTSISTLVTNNAMLQ
jgi:hypothetical protein